MALTTHHILTFLQLRGIGPKAVQILLQKSVSEKLSFSSSDELFDYINYCISNKFLPRIKFPFEVDDFDFAYSRANSIIDRSRDLGITTISVVDSCFPTSLKTIVDSKGKSNAPLILYVKGNIEALSMPHAIAIIGTREPSVIGVQAGEYFSQKFASAGFNIVSGLALGCDTAAHKGALSVNGITTAFVASGLDMPIYPQGNTQLAKDIIENGGALISEYPIGEPYMANRFVERDRLQSGLANACLAIQTGIKGGTLHAVNATIDNRKPLYMVQFRGAELNYEKVQGNKMFLESGKALPLSTENIDAVIESLKSLKVPFTSAQPTLFD